MPTWLARVYSFVASTALSIQISDYEEAIFFVEQQRLMEIRGRSTDIV
jgi:hypothetical protein